MAKGDVTLKFDANTAAFVQKTLEAKAALDATAKSARDSGQHVAKAGEQWEKFGEKASDAVKDIGKHAAGMLGIPLSISGAIELGFKTIEAAMEKTAKKAEELTRRTITLNQALASAGRMSSAPQVRRDLEEMAGKSYAGRQFDTGTVEKQFAQIYNQVGTKTSIAGGMAATEAALKAQAADMSPESATQLGVGVANLSRLMPGASQEELENLAYSMQVNAPGAMNDARSLRFLSRAKNKDFALKALAAAAQSDESARALTAIQNEIEQQPSRQELGSMSPIERRRYKAIQEAGGDYQAIFADPDKFLSAKSAIDARALARGAANVRSAGTLGGAMGTAVQNEGEAGLMVRSMANTETFRGRRIERGALGSLNETEIQERAKSIFAEEHPNWNLVPGFSQASAWGLTDSNKATAGQRIAGTMTTRDEAILQLLMEQNKIVLEGNELARQQINATKTAAGAPNPALNNGKEGQK